MASFTVLQKPTALVEEQAALLNDAIVEASEEEASVEEIESNPNSLSVDSLQGIKALDATREESFLEMDDSAFVTTAADEFANMVRLPLSAFNLTENFDFLY